MKFYGREKEFKVLMHGYEAACNGEKQILFIAGPAGIGKTALVKKLFELAPTKDGYFISGKFEKLKQHMPYSAFSSAFGELARQILAESEVSFTLWKKKLLKVQREIEVIADAVPEISLIYGKQRKVPELVNPKEAQSRFLLAFCELIKAAANQNNPLIIFMDDLQWADPASIQLIKYISLETKLSHMLLICAYRDDAAEEAEAGLSELPCCIQTERQNVRNILIQSFGLDDVNKYLTDIFDSSGENVFELSKHFYRRTGGNPFLLKRLLRTVLDEGMLSYSTTNGWWEWDLKKIENLQVEENMLRFTRDALFRLPEEALDTIKLGSCIGSEFDVEILSCISKKEDRLLIKQLEQAAEKELILPTVKDSDVSGYTFTHDCIREAAYSLISESEKQEIHLKIGRSMYKLSEGAIQQKILFRVVNQYDKGIELLNDLKEKRMLAGLNLSAGTIARELAAYDTALYYFETGKNLLNDDDWENQDRMIYELCTGCALCMYLCGDFQGADKLFERLLSCFESKMDRANIYSLKTVLHTAEGNNTEAVQSGLKALESLGAGSLKPPGKTVLALEIVKWRIAAGSKRAEDLICMKQLDDPIHEKLSEVYMNMCAPSNITAPELFPLLLLKLGNITFQYGNSVYSPIGYAGYAIVAGSIMGDYKNGGEYEKAAVALCERYNKAGVNCITFFILGSMVCHWIKPIQTGIEYIEKSIACGREAGDFLFEGFSHSILVENKYLTGSKLDEVYEQCCEARAFLQKFNHSNLQKNVIIYEQAINNLKAWSGSFDFSDANVSKEDFEQSMSDDKAALITYCFVKMQMYYLFGDYEAAKQAADRARPMAGEFMGYFISSDYELYDGLIAAASCEKTNDKMQKGKHRKHLKMCLRRLEKWADHCSNNFEHKYLMLNAEWERINGNDAQAMTLYDDAVRSAWENGFLQNAALASELAGNCYLRRGLPKVADVYLKEACNGYLHWGADEKAAHLDRKVSALNPEEVYKKELQHSAGTLRNGGSEANHEDMISRAVRNISDETEPDKILGSFLQMVLENTGAVRGFLILERNGRLYVEASIELDEKDCADYPVLLDKCDSISRPIVRYVFRTLEPILYYSGEEVPLLRNDPYIADHCPKSILGLPILLQGIAMGVLYLEDDNEVGKFALEKLDVLKLLSTQMFYVNKLQKFMEEELPLRGKGKMPAVNLSQREGEVLTLLAQGLSNKEIAKKLGVTVNTVKVFINSIYNKLGVSRRIQAVIKGRELNLIDS